MKKSYYITTPIYYPNGAPHIGHAYASCIVDTIARYKKAAGYDTRVVTGIDENSQKIVEAAKEKGMCVGEYTDKMAHLFKNTWKEIDTPYSYFVRTTSEDHKHFVQKVLQKTYDAGDIYLGEYVGMYCVGCESFKTERDLIEKKDEVTGTCELICPDHPNKKIEHLKEKNYFFRLSNYTDRLLKFYADNPEWITPRNRYNEIIEFVKGGLEDFSISRESNKIGIPLPFDAKQVTYVWYDALFSYISACQEDEAKWWPAALHVIAKDIIKFHGIYWPAMLWSAGYELPKGILTTGYFTVDGQKMSKTIGNVIDPVEYVKKYSRDALLLYLFSAVPIGEDGDFNQHQAPIMYNAKLANNIGNLLSRITALTLKIGGTIKNLKNKEVGKVGSDILEEYISSMDHYDLRTALEMCFEYASDINKYIDTAAPWKLDIGSEEEREKLEHILFSATTHLRKVALLLSPFFPQKMQELLLRISTPLEDEKTLRTQYAFSPDSFIIGEKGSPLYTRINA